MPVMWENLEFLC